MRDEVAQRLVAPASAVVVFNEDREGRKEFERYRTAHPGLIGPITTITINSRRELYSLNNGISKLQRIALQNGGNVVQITQLNEVCPNGPASYLREYGYIANLYRNPPTETPEK